MMSPSPPWTSLPGHPPHDKANPASHACPEPSGVGAFGCCRSLGLPPPQLGVTRGHEPGATSCCHLLPAQGAGTGLAAGPAPSHRVLEETPVERGMRGRGAALGDLTDLIFTQLSGSGFWGEGHPIPSCSPPQLPPPTQPPGGWKGKGGGDARGGVVGPGSCTTLFCQGQNPHCLRQGTGRENAPCMPGGDPKSLVAEAFCSPKCSRLSQSSQTPFAIETWARLSLKAFGNPPRGIPQPRSPPQVPSSTPLPGNPQEHPPHDPPAPPCT